MIGRSPRSAPAGASATALAAALLALATACSAAAEGPHVVIRGEPIAVEIVDTPEAQRRGLGGRDRLPEGRGMLFPYDRPGMHTFWMKDMRFDIDIVWIRDGRVVDIRPDVPHPADPTSTRLPTYAPRAAADLVLEVAAGTAARHSWRIGDRVETRLR